MFLFFQGFCMIKITVVVPVYNLGLYLLPSIESLSNQTLNNDEFEVLFVNDGSTDDSTSIIQKYAKCNYRIINQENGRIGAALNNGIRSATGEYVLFLDGDDALSSTALATIWDASNRNNLDILFYGMKKKMSDNSTRSMRTYCDEECNKVMSPESYLKSCPLTLNCHYTYKRDFLIRNNLFFVEKVLHEDSEFILRACSVATRIMNITDVLYYHIDRSCSITNTYTKQRLLDLSKMIRHMLNYSIERKNTSIASSLFYYNSMCFNSALKIYRMLSHEDKIVCRETITQLRKDVIFVMLRSRFPKYIIEGIILNLLWDAIF